VITTHRSRYRVTTPDGFLVAICDCREDAEYVDQQRSLVAND